LGVFAGLGRSVYLPANARPSLGGMGEIDSRRSALCSRGERVTAIGAADADDASRQACTLISGSMAGCRSGM
jgi:hypothetical protein